MKLLLVAMLALTPWLRAAQRGAAADEITALNQLLPPGPQPVPVKTGFYLVNLVSVEERSETFQADIYLSFEWKDTRLAFVPKEGEPKVKVLMEEAVEEKLKEIWWPQLEYINIATPQITNRLLRIDAEGTVRYELGMSGCFRAKLNFKSFPFDRQELPIRIQSFLWQKEHMVFVPDTSKIGFSPKDGFADMSVKNVTANVSDSRVIGWGEEYSEYAAHILTYRDPVYYIWQVFFPVILVMFLSCSIFYVDIASFSDRIGISLTCLLACVALQFTVNCSLPRIAYQTPIDRLFVATYSCTALGVIVSVVENALTRKQHRLKARIDLLSRWFVPGFYLAMILFMVLPHWW
jgi:hypothetical protein